MPEFNYRRNVQQIRHLLETTCNESLRRLLLESLAKEEASEPRPERPPQDRLAAPRPAGPRKARRPRSSSATAAVETGDDASEPEALGPPQPDLVVEGG